MYAIIMCASSKDHLLKRTGNEIEKNFLAENKIRIGGICLFTVFTDA
jgi:hypothetical protein